MYHSIREKSFIPPTLYVSPVYFESQMQFLIKYFHIISLENYSEMISAGHTPLRNTAILTFDDGYKDNYQYAFPILRHLEIPATIFLPTRCIDLEQSTWDIKLYYWFANTKKTKLHLIDDNTNSQYEFSFHEKSSKKEMVAKVIHLLLSLNKEGKNKLLSQIENQLASDLEDRSFQELALLSWDEIIDMAANNISFGAHTDTHQVLSKIPLNEVEYEIKSSKTLIEVKSMQQINTFAYPFGDKEHFNDQTKALLKKYGFKCACSTIKGINNNMTDPFELKRIQIKNWPLPIFAWQLLRSLIKY